MTLTKDEFSAKFQPLLTDPAEKLPISNPQLATFIDEFIDKNGGKFLGWRFQDCLLALCVTMGIPFVLVGAFGKKKICIDLSPRQSLKINDLYDFHTNVLDFDLDSEIPLLFHYQGSINETRLLVTNQNIYYSLSKSKKVKDVGQKSIGKIALADIASFDVKPHSISSMLTLIVNGQEIGAMHCDKAQAKSANNLRMLFQTLIVKKDTLLG